MNGLFVIQKKLKNLHLSSHNVDTCYHILWRHIDSRICYIFFHSLPNFCYW